MTGRQTFDEISDYFGTQLWMKHTADPGCSPRHTQDQTKLQSTLCSRHWYSGEEYQFKECKLLNRVFFFCLLAFIYVFLACLLHGNSPMCLSSQNRSHLVFLKWLHINIFTLAVNTCKCHCLSQLTVSLSKEDNVEPWERSQGWTALCCNLCVFLSNWDGQ